MSRSGYSDDCDNNWSQIMWRGTVASSIRGKRGQALLREIAEAMDAMPTKRLITNDLRRTDGEVCALGTVADRRGVDTAQLDPEDYEAVAAAFGVAAPLVQEIVWMNDDAWWYNQTPEQRWARMREWIGQQIKRPKEESDGSSPINPLVLKGVGIP